MTTKETKDSIMKYKLNPFQMLVLEILCMILMDYPQSLRTRLLSRINKTLKEGEIDI